MKMKMKKGRQGTVRLSIVTDADEELRYAEAERVGNGCDPTLFPFSYEKRKHGYLFQYYTGTARLLSDYLKQPIPLEYVRAMFNSFLQLARVCETEPLSIQRVSFLYDHLFFDPAQYTLKFIYLPVQKPKHWSGGDPLSALAAIADNAIVEDADSQRIADAVFDYASRTSMFSWIDFEAVLREYGIAERRSEPTPSRPSSAGPETSPLDVRGDYGWDFVSDHLSASSVVRGQETAAVAEVKPSQVRWVLEELPEGGVWQLRDETVVLGSSSDCDIVLDKVGVSRRHARLALNDGRWTIEDLASTNGTRVNGLRIRPHEPFFLDNQTRIQLGRACVLLTAYGRQ